MKNKTLQIQIPSPCTEDWAAMQPRGAGRHCAQCDRVIMDFTDVSDAEIVRLFQFHQGKLCGRFREDQLNRKMPFPAPVAPASYKSVALLSGLLLAGGVAAQTHTTPPGREILPTISTRAPLPVSAKPATKIEGVVVDEQGNALIAATVCIESLSKGKILVGTDTDFDGFFKITPPQIGLVKLVVSYMGYEDYIMILDLGKQPEKLHIVLKDNGRLMFTGVVVVAGDVEVVEEEVEDNQAKIIPPFEEKPAGFSAQVSPNPFVDRLKVEMTIDVADTYLFALYGTAGQLVYAESRALDKGQLHVALSLPSNLPAASYWLHITRDDELIATQQVIRQ